MKKGLLICIALFTGLVVKSHNDDDKKNYEFVKNVGQFDKRVKFKAELKAGSLFLEKNKFTFDLISPEFVEKSHDLKTSEKQENPPLSLQGLGIDPASIKRHAYSMNFLNSSPNVSSRGNHEFSSYKNFYLGNDPEKWTTNVKSYGEIEYSNLYDKIDARVYTKDFELKYDLVVYPGGDIENVQIKYEGVDQVLVKNNELIIKLSTGDIKEKGLYAYQFVNGKEIKIPCFFKVNGDVVSFSFPNGYDNTKRLIIDPTWVFATLTGATSDNWGFTSTYDSQGNLYAAGISFGTGYPTVGAYDATYNGGIDVSLSKFSPDGVNLLYSTYIGGGELEMPTSLVTDSMDNLYLLAIAGDGYPTLNGYDNTFNGGETNTAANMWGSTYTSGTDIVLSKFNSIGNLLASTYVGGSSNDGLNQTIVYNYSDQARGEIVLGNNGDIFVGTSVISTDFPMANNTINNGNGFGFSDAILFRMSDDLSNLMWSTYAGGVGFDAGYSVRYSKNNNLVYICGGTNSGDFGTTSGVISETINGATTNNFSSLDGFVASYNINTGVKVAATYLGTSDYDQTYILEIDQSGDIYSFGQSRGAYPVVNASYSNANGSQFIHKMSSDLTTTFYSSVFGSGSARVNISPTAFLVDNCGNVYVSGWGGGYNGATNFGASYQPQAQGNTNNMPISGDAQQSTTDGQDFYFAVFERDMQSLLYGTYMGSNLESEHTDGGTSRFDPGGIVYQSVCAACNAASFPTTPGVYAENTGYPAGCNMGAIKFEMNFQGVEATATSPGDQILCGSQFDVDFDAGGTPPNTYWDFGDNNTLGIGTDYTPTHTYADSGTYNVMYVAIDSSSCNIADTAYFSVTLIQPEQLNATIDVPPYDPCTTGGLTVDYEFTGSGADSLYWDMGDGTTYNDSTDFSYTYNSNGTYYVEFQAYEFTCNTSITIRDTIDFNPTFTTVTATSPGDQQLCGSPFNVDFDAGGTPPNTYWDFGDGNTLGVGVDYTPTHEYGDTGTYTVTFVAIDSTTCNIADSVDFTIVIENIGDMQAEIDIPPYDPCTTGGLTVDYEFTGTGADSLYWDLGDGTTYNDSTDFSYTYNNNGTYFVELIAFDFGCGQVTIRDTIEFNPSFTTVQAVNPGDQTICAAPFEVSFDAGGTPPNTYWDFGDGTTLGIGVDYTPTHTYADTGTYTVTSVAIDSTTCNIADSVTFDVTIIQPEQLDAQFTIPPYDHCQSTLDIEVEFTGTGADSIYWDMGDGTTFINDTLVNHTYMSQGTYNLVFQAYDFECNISDTVIEVVDFNPTYTSVQAVDPGDQTICTAPFNVTFDAGGTPPNTYWDFGDGNTLGVGVDYTPTHTYGDTGTYTILSVAIDSTTCNLADTAEFTITIIQPETFDAQFDIPPYDPCQSTLTIDVEFTGSGADSLYWDFGDGASSNNSTDQHTYTTPGVYTLELHAFDFDCNNNAVISEVISFNPNVTTVDAVVPPSIESCDGDLTVEFSSGNPAPPQNIWDFGDGNTSTQIHPTHTYGDTGTYVVTFTAIDSNTCNIFATESFNVTINAVPEISVVMDYTPPKPCEAIVYEVNLSATLENADSIYWDMGDGTEFINDTVINYTYATHGNYTITATLFNQCGPKSFTYNASFMELGESEGIIPNVFTPNGDGMNDELEFLGVDFTQDYSLKIFNRWGRMMFESTNPDDRWKGDNAEDGTYFYELRYTDQCSTEERLVTGTVSLLGKNQ